MSARSFTKGPWSACNDGSVDCDVAAANARLIAAAPELYEALHSLERYLRDTPHHNAPEAAAARAVLRKVEGNP